MKGRILDLPLSGSFGRVTWDNDMQCLKYSNKAGPWACPVSLDALWGGEPWKVLGASTEGNLSAVSSGWSPLTHGMEGESPRWIPTHIMVPADCLIGSSVIALVIHSES